MKMFRMTPLAAAVLAVYAAPGMTQEPAAEATPAAETAPAAESQHAVAMPAVHVQDSEAPTYKADTVASPKFTQPLLDTPQTIQVITSTLFNQQGATTLTEALRNSAGVGTFYAGENGATNTGDTIYMRGFDASSSIFVDGVRDLGSVSHDLFNIDQIEVEKGPAGTDNGRTSPSGAINMSTKQATLDNAVYSTLTTGTDSQNRATADLNQKFNGLEGSAMRLNVLWQDSDVAGRDHVNNSRTGIAPSLGFGLNGKTRAYVNLLYVKQDNIPDGFVPTIGLPGWTPQPGLEQLAGHPVDSENFYGTHYDHEDSTSKMGTLRVEHDFSDKLKLSNVARWGMTTQDYLLTSFMGTGTAANSGNIKWTDQNDLSTYTIARSGITYKDQQNKILTDQLNLRYDFSTGSIEHNLSTGLEVAREEQFAHTNVATAGSVPAANLYDPDWNDRGTLSYGRNGAGSQGRTTTGSLYAFDTLKISQRFLVTGGIRVDHYKTEYDSSAVCTTTTPVPRGGVACPSGAADGSLIVTNDLDDKDTLFNWKLGAVYKPIESASLYVNYALAQQPPGGTNFQLAATSASLGANTVNADPQKTETYEIGGKWDVLREMLSLNLAFFQTEISNEIDNTDPLDITQDGKKRVQGVEAWVVGNITSNWLITAGYTDQDTKVKTGPNVTADGSSNLAYTPGKAFTSWTTYRLPFGVTLGGGVRYVDGLHRGTDGAVGTPAYTKSYTVTDALASYDVNTHMTLRVNAYNLFDKDYVAAINKSGYRYTPGTPRTFLFSGDFSF